MFKAKLQGSKVNSISDRITDVVSVTLAFAIISLMVCSYPDQLVVNYRKRYTTSNFLRPLTMQRQNFRKSTDFNDSHETDKHKCCLNSELASMYNYYFTYYKFKSYNISSPMVTHTFTSNLSYRKHTGQDKTCNNLHCNHLQF